MDWRVIVVLVRTVVLVAGLRAVAALAHLGVAPRSAVGNLHAGERGAAAPHRILVAVAVAIAVGQLELVGEERRRVAREREQPLVVRPRRLVLDGEHPCRGVLPAVRDEVLRGDEADGDGHLRVRRVELLAARPQRVVELAPVLPDGVHHERDGGGLPCGRVACARLRVEKPAREERVKVRDEARRHRQLAQPVLEEGAARLEPDGAEVALAERLVAPRERVVVAVHRGALLVLDQAEVAQDALVEQRLPRQLLVRALERVQAAQQAAPDRLLGVGELGDQVPAVRRAHAVHAHGHEVVVAEVLARRLVLGAPPRAARALPRAAERHAEVAALEDRAALKRQRGRTAERGQHRTARVRAVLALPPRAELRVHLAELERPVGRRGEGRAGGDGGVHVRRARRRDVQLQRRHGELQRRHAVLLGDRHVRDAPSLAFAVGGTVPIATAVPIAVTVRFAPHLDVAGARRREERPVALADARHRRVDVGERGGQARPRRRGEHVRRHRPRHERLLRRRRGRRQRGRRRGRLLGNGGECVSRRGGACGKSRVVLALLGEHGRAQHAPEHLPVDGCPHLALALAERAHDARPRPALAHARAADGVVARQQHGERLERLGVVRAPAAAADGVGEERRDARGGVRQPARVRPARGERLAGAEQSGGLHEDEVVLVPRRVVLAVVPWARHPRAVDDELEHDLLGVRLPGCQGVRVVVGRAAVHRLPPPPVERPADEDGAALGVVAHFHCGWLYCLYYLCCLCCSWCGCVSRTSALLSATI